MIYEDEYGYLMYFHIDWMEPEVVDLCDVMTGYTKGYGG